MVFRAPMRAIQIFLWLCLTMCVATWWGNSARASNFTLNEISFSSTKLFSKKQLEELSKPYLARPLQKAEIQYLANIITQIYQDNGYLLSRAVVDFVSKSQKKARIRLIEMDQNFDVQNLSSNTAKRIILNENQKSAFSVPSLQQKMMLLNEMPGHKFQTIVTPNKNKTAFNIKTTEEKETYKARYFIDNYASPDRSHDMRFISEIEAYSILPYLDVLGVRGAEYTGQDNVRYGEIYTESWIGNHGLRFKNRWGKIDSASLQSDFGFLAQGKSEFFQSSLFIPFDRTPQLKTSAEISLRHLTSESSIFDLNFFSDKVDVVSFMWQVSTITPSFITDTELSISQGIDQLFYRGNSDFLSRADGNLSFTKLNFDHKQSIAIKNSRLVINNNARGQLSFDPVVASEEFAVGGPDIGRAFPFATISGDDGLSLSVELTAPKYEIIPQIFETQLYSFVDGGIAHQKSSFVQESNYDAIISAGAGVRGKVFDATNIKFELSNPIYRNGDLARDDSSPRISFAISGEF